MSFRDKKVVGGIAGAAAMAAGTHAYAISLVAPPANVVASIGTTTASAWDPDGNAVNDFVFQFRFPNTTGTLGVVFQGNMNPNTALGNAVVGYLGAFINYGTNLTLGQNVGPTINGGTPPAVGTASFRTAAQVTLGSVYRSGGIPTGYGGFSPGTLNPGGAAPGANTGYAGFRLGTGASARYGWLQLTNSIAGITFTAAALGDVGEQVRAGVVPEPTTLSALALGAAAFLRRPRKCA